MLWYLNIEIWHHLSISGLMFPEWALVTRITDNLLQNRIGLQTKKCFTTLIYLFSWIWTGLQHWEPMDCGWGWMKMKWGFSWKSCWSLPKLWKSCTEQSQGHRHGRKKPGIRGSIRRETRERKKNLSDLSSLSTRPLSILTWFRHNTTAISWQINVKTVLTLHYGYNNARLSSTCTWYAKLTSRPLTNIT